MFETALISQALAILAELGAEEIVNQAKRSKWILRANQRLGFRPDTPPIGFEATYATALLLYGAGRGPKMRQLFGDLVLQEIFFRDYTRQFGNGSNNFRPSISSASTDVPGTHRTAFFENELRQYLESEEGKQRYAPLNASQAIEQYTAFYLIFQDVIAQSDPLGVRLAYNLDQLITRTHEIQTLLIRLVHAQSLAGALNPQSQNEHELLEAMRELLRALREAADSDRAETSTQTADALKEVANRLDMLQDKVAAQQSVNYGSQEQLDRIELLVKVASGMIVTGLIIIIMRDNYKGDEEKDAPQEGGHRLPSKTAFHSRSTHHSWFYRLFHPQHAHDSAYNDTEIVEGEVLPDITSDLWGSQATDSSIHYGTDPLGEPSLLYGSELPHEWEEVNGNDFHPNAGDESHSILP